jgi:glycerol uptake facilitator-like aquaporin
MHGPLFGEFMGTMVLILFGDGVVANVLLKKSKGEGRNMLFRSRYLSKKESLRRMPMLNPDRLVGTIAYADLQFDDTRYNCGFR